MHNTINAQSLYDKDFYAWTQEQARLIKTNAFNKLDFLHLEQELQIMGASEKRELESRLEVFLIHLLQWKYQPVYINKRSWERRIKEQRKKLARHFKDNPSLATPETLNKRFEEAYEMAVLRAADETGLDDDAFPARCEWSIEQVLDDEFFPN